MNEHNPNYVLDTDKICQYLKEQMDSFKDLMNEKFERVFEHQSIMNTRMEERKKEIADVKEDITKVEKDLIQLKTEKNTSIRNTRWMVIGIGVILAAMEIYILMTK